MSELTDLVARVFRAEKRQADAERHGTILKGEKGKYRVLWGINAEGQPLTSPWLFPGQHAGIKREDVPFRKGQNVTVSMPGGDPRQARVLPFSPNDENPRPVHAAEDICTVQIPHIDKDGKEEKDKNKPGFQRSESSSERKTEVDKKTTHSQTADKFTHEAKDAWDGKAKALIEQTFGKVSRLLDGGKGVTSLLEQEVERMFHRVGDKVSHEATLSGFVRKVSDSVLSHGPLEFLHQVQGAASSLRQGPAGFIRMVGSSMMSHGPAQILHSLGGVQHLLSPSGILGQFGGISHLVGAAGNLFSGGSVSHDGADIGKSHQHMVPGPFGNVLSMIPQMLGGGSQGGGGGGTGSGGSGPPTVVDLQIAATPFAWASVTPGAGGALAMPGSARGIAVTGSIGNIQVQLLSPPASADYRVHLAEDTAVAMKVVNRTKAGFLLTQVGSTAPTRVGIMVFP